MNKPQDKKSNNKSRLSFQTIHNIVTDTRPKKPTTDAASTGANLNRRRFVQGMGMSVAGGVSLGLAGCQSDNDGFFDDLHLIDNEVIVRFEHGVASGDPLADRVILWTRVTPQGTHSNRIRVTWAIANDESMADIVSTGEVTTSASDDYTVKVDADNLKSATTYYYQFSVGKRKSRVGKTKTLPTDNVDQIKLAVFSCANYPAGFFHAYADAAKRNDIDACVHLGDYIYEYGRVITDENGQVMPAYASANAAAINREVEPETETININEYRRRYAQYRGDKDLQDLHASVPMIAVWDDHELANDTFVQGAENHQPNEGQWDKRKLAAITAYHEWMPIRNSVPSEIYRRFDFGELLSLHMLDTRVIGRDKQLDYKDFIKPDATGTLYIDTEAFFTATNDEQRQLLGLKQANWLVNQFQTSTATWQILGQQILMARMLMPAPVILNIVDPNSGMNFFSYMSLINKGKNAPQTLTPAEKAILAQPPVPYNLDAWDGYSAAREQILTAAKSLNKNLVVLAGDTHNAWSSNLTNAAQESVGVEFATSSVTSPGFEEYLPTINPALLQAVLPQVITDLQYTNSSERGYMLITVTPETCQSDWIFVSDILQKTYSSRVGKTLSVKVGENRLSTS